MNGKVLLSYEMGAPGRRGFRLPELDVPERDISGVVGAENLRKNPPALPELSEIEAVRHFTALSALNFGVDTGFYPLGSCTMKYNPKVNELVSALPGFAGAHPMSPDGKVQGCLRLIYELEGMLSNICGMAAFTLQPAAGAHGELTGLMIIAAWHRACGSPGRDVILIPDSAHGTNPASAAQAGFRVRVVPSDARGLVDMEALRAAVADTGASLAGLMLTNPNTLGLFERDILAIADLIHGAGGLLYYDGANLNAVMGHTSPGAMRFDVVHVNLHKTFSTPHGGGGPGSGPVGVCEKLIPFLPGPRVALENGAYRTAGAGPLSIGRVRSFWGNFGVYVRAYAYILSCGADGLREVSGTAVLCANYLMSRLKDAYLLPKEGPCMHEFVLSAERLRERTGVSAMDIAKGLLDRGYHAPTVYFPLIVKEAMMIEPTETETPETLDEFAEVMLELMRIAREDPEALRRAPENTPVSRPDDVLAARKPELKA